VKFEAIEFTPHEIPNVASNPKYKDQLCGGVYVNVVNRNIINSVKIGLAVVSEIHTLYSDSLKFRERRFDRLAGTPVIREMLLQGKPVNEIEETWKEELQAFMKLRKESLLYLK
jgi:beta-N-acetylhexosaminidase